MKSAYEKSEWEQIARKLKYTGITAVILILVLAGILGFKNINQNNQFNLSKAPNLVLKSADGKDIDLSKLRGKMVYIDFWASWCESCREVSTDQNQLLLNQESPLPVEMISISLDDSGKDWLEAVARDNVSWKHQVCELTSWNSEAAKAFNVRILPANFLIDQNGKIIARNITTEEFKAILKEENS